jgi:LysM repeat protein
MATLKSRSAKPPSGRGIPKSEIPTGADWESFLWGGKPKKGDDKTVAATAKPARRGEKKITIKPGQTLSALAKANGTTLGAIRRANPGRFPTAASLNKIRAGEKINMPPDVKATTPYDVKTVRVKPRKRKAKTVSPPSPKRKPTGPEVFWERARRTRKEASEYKHGGGIKKSINGGGLKKSIKRASLRGGRAELRGV